jgi:hypothetical protein
VAVFVPRLTGGGGGPLVEVRVTVGPKIHHFQILRFQGEGQMAYRLDDLSRSGHARTQFRTKALQGTEIEAFVSQATSLPEQFAVQSDCKNAFVSIRINPENADSLFRSTCLVGRSPAAISKPGAVAMRPFLDGLWQRSLK